MAQALVCVYVLLSLDMLDPSLPPSGAESDALDKLDPHQLLYSLLLPWRWKEHTIRATYSDMASVGNLDIAAANAAGAFCQADQPRSPLSDQDRARLEHSLGHRPDRQELQEKNILKPGNLAPALQARRDELQKSQLADKLEGRLERRPEKDELVIRGILKDQSVAPSLQAKRDELQKHQLTHKLEARLERRPEKDQLVNRGILKHQSVAPALQAKKEELERARLGNQLHKQLQQRPDVHELKHKGILTHPEHK